MSNFELQVPDEYIRLQEVTNDHQIRAVIAFTSFIDIDRLQQAILFSFQMVPILACKYVQKGYKALWEALSHIDLDSFFSIHEGQNLEQTVLSYLKDTPNSDDGPQVKFNLIRGDNHDTLVVVLNHMVFDGHGFKEYLYLLSELYSDPERYHLPNLDQANQERCLSRLLKNLTFFQKLQSLRRKTIITENNPAILVNTFKVSESRFIYHKIDRETFLTIKQICHERQITLNDFTLALFAEALFRIKGGEGETQIVIQTMFDMRRYVNRYPVSAFGNFSSMESVLITKDNSFMDLLSQISRGMRKIKENLPGIKSLMMLNFLYKILPRKVFEQILSATIQSLGVSTSNLGIIDDKRLIFAETEVYDAYLLTSIKNEPAMQLTLSTYKNEMTLNLLGNYSEDNWRVIQDLFSNINSVLMEVCNP